MTWKSGRGKKFQLFRDNILLFFSVVLDFYIFSASKYAIEAHMADRDLAVYGAIFMPTSVINLVAGFVIRPYPHKARGGLGDRPLKSIPEDHHEPCPDHCGPDRSRGGRCVVIGNSGDQPAVPKLKRRTFHLPHGVGTDHHRRRLNAFMNLFYYSLIIMQKQRFIILGYAFVSVLAVLSSGWFVRMGGIQEAPSYTCF